MQSNKPPFDVTSMQIFHEVWKTTPPHTKVYPAPLMCFADSVEGFPGLISMVQTWVEVGDPSGRKWAAKYFKNPEILDTILENKYGRAWADKAIQRIKDNLKQQALNKLQELLSHENANTAMAAAKTLLDYSMDKKEAAVAAKRGRPSKDEVQAEVARLAKEAKEAKDDASRIKLAIVD